MSQQNKPIDGIILSCLKIINTFQIVFFSHSSLTIGYAKKKETECPIRFVSKICIISSFIRCLFDIIDPASQK